MNNNGDAGWPDPEQQNKAEYESRNYTVSTQQIYIKATAARPSKAKNSGGTWLVVIGLLVLVGGPIFLLIWPGISAIQRFWWPVPVGEIGTPSSYSGYTLTVNKLERTASFEQAKAELGRDFVLLDVSYESGGDEDLSSTLFFEHIWLKDAQGFLYDSLSSSCKLALRDNSGKLSKGSKVRGWVAFDIPTAATGLVLDFPLSRGFNKKSPLRMSVRLELQAQATPPPLIGQAVGNKGQIGQILSQSSYLMLVNSFNISTQIQVTPTELRKAAVGKKWVLLNLTFQSTADSGVYVNPNSATLKDEDSFVYKNTYPAYQPDLVAIGPVPNGYKVQGWVAFEVPDTAQNFTLEYRTNDKNLMSVSLKP